ncbi:MAG TPA: hypothetical protein VFE17_03800 [Candidatus Baltobacteraceae bacterium]|nr:hypothetical protein [Candidatus Baltobacteraceae bacterium]
MIQHAVEDVPNRSTGYCTDDISRAYMVALAKLEIDPQDAAAQRLAGTYLSFLHDAQLPDGRFHNFMSYERTWLDAVGTHDSVGRAIWSLGYGMRYAQRTSWRRTSKKLFVKAMRSLEWLTYARSQAYAMIGLAHAGQSGIADDDAPEYYRALRRLAEDFKRRYLDVRDAQWQWFENELTYDNARLPEAVLRAGLLLHDDELIAIGLRTFDFYQNATVENGVHVPVGNEGWYPRGGTKAKYAQQPLEAAALVDAALVAYDATGDPAYRACAQLGLDWYYGRNSRGIAMARSGGCLDGLNETSVNMNMGAESTLAYLASAYAVAARPAAALSVAR